MSKIKSAYFREGQHYSFFDLKERFGLDVENTHARINILKRYSVLKIVRRNKPEYSDLSDQDIVIGDVPDDSTEFAYQFSFVGVILLDDLVVKCYPKYISFDNACGLLGEFKIALKAIEHYNQKEQLVHLYNGDAECKVFNRLAIALHILHDFFDNGLYSNQVEVLEQNGSGEILWDKTINETFAIIKKNTPYYLDYFTTDQTDNDQDYIRRLHSAIVSECSRMLKNCEALDLFNLQEAELSEQNIEDFGDTDYIKYRLERELKNQFVTQKQNLLKTLYTYISETKSNDSQNSISFYGTNCMNLVWEKACGQIFGNIHDQVESEIAKPQWYLNGVRYEASKSLIPDIITECNIEYDNDYEKVFCILDAKYYLIKAENLSSGMGIPGVQDVVKQFVYHESFMNYLRRENCESVFNAFLFPIANEDDAIKRDIIIRGFVTMLKWGVEQLVPIYLVFLKPSFVWTSYLNGSIQKTILIDAMKRIRLEDVFRKVLKYPDTLKFME